MEECQVGSVLFSVSSAFTSDVLPVLQRHPHDVEQLLLLEADYAGRTSVATFLRGKELTVFVPGVCSVADWTCLTGKELSRLQSSNFTAFLQLRWDCSLLDELLETAKGDPRLSVQTDEELLEMKRRALGRVPAQVHERERRWFATIRRAVSAIGEGRVLLQIHYEYLTLTGETACLHCLLNRLQSWR